MNIEAQLVDAPINLKPWETWLADPDVGSHLWFHGVTRRTTVVDGESRVTKSLWYEAHRPMAIAQLRRLAEEAVSRFSLVRILVIHRLGEVPVGEASIVIGCSSPHRIQSIEAVAWTMNAIKQNVPIWKQDCDASGTQEWIHPDPSAPESTRAESTSTQLGDADPSG